MSLKKPAIGWRIVIASLIVAGTALSGAHLTYERKIESLELQLAQEREARKQQVVETQHLIDELTALSDQAMMTQWRMRDLEQLERKLRQLTGSDSILSAVSELSDPPQGGLLLMPEPRQIPKSAKQVQDKYNQLLRSVEHITSRYHDMVETFESIDEALRKTPIMRPTASHTINSSFGLRKDPFTHRSAQHNGIDIDGAYGDPVYAAADGIVTSSGYDRFHGNHVIIEHNSMYTTVYSHMNKTLVRIGDVVTRGDQIGEIGSTGRSTGPHLHYEVHRNEQAVDPEPYLLIDP